ncbi:unnamed protein product [Phytomonas sp. EM1]|nr:unnamed protein product [Phytomonas sp. EM1]|eukprot:CCW62478.1 unnamed protein product [Phytomonas sp. isolate EM1]
MTSIEVLSESSGDSLTSIQRLWNNRLGPCRSLPVDATSTAMIAKYTSEMAFTPSSFSSHAGLTDSLGSSRKASAISEVATSTQTDLRKRAHEVGADLVISPCVRRRSASREREVSDEVIAGRLQEVLVESPRVCKPLFSAFLLQGFDPDEALPALTLVLDLDETLVCNRSPHAQRPILRPYALHMLNALRHMVDLEIVLWTASTKETATRVVQRLHSNGIIFDDVIFRNNLWFTEPVYTKDLRLLGRDMDKVVIVDNAANSCKLNPRNALLIEDFHGHRDAEDAALVNVYYAVDALLRMAKDGISVRDGLTKLAETGLLCHEISIPIPPTWKNMPLSSISPIKLPPFGKFVKSNTKPPSRSIMGYWTF